MEFHNRRRQQFLNERAYSLTITFHKDVSVPGYRSSLTRQDRDAEDKSLNADALADDVFSDFLLKYTAGESLDLLRVELEDVIAAHELAAKYVRIYQKSTTFPPLRFVEIDEYERVMQMIGLCFLLHRRDLLPRIAELFDPAFANRDTLYEDLLAFHIEERYELDSWYHDAPYRDLINSLYRDTDDESCIDIQRYLKGWYSSMARAPWHDSHLSMDDESCAGYFGYWAIEAAAVVYLMELDDTSFREHLVYPKDLVDFAREMVTAAEFRPVSKQDLSSIRVEGGQTCPKAGYWTTPAQRDSRRLFQLGEIMPKFEQSAYGATIWQWSDEE